MYAISEESTITGELAAIWQAATDVADWPIWDPHEEQARIDGPFEPGVTGWVKPRGAPAGSFTIVAVNPHRHWSSRARIPFGSLQGHYGYESLGDGTVRVTKRLEVHGPFAPIFRLIWANGVRADMRLSFIALEAQAQRLANAATPGRG